MYENFSLYNGPFKQTLPSLCVCVCVLDGRCDVVCGLSGPQLSAPDDREIGAGGRVAVPPTRRVPDCQLQRGPAALLSDRTPYLTTIKNVLLHSEALTNRGVWNRTVRNKMCFNRWRRSLSLTVKTLLCGFGCVTDGERTRSDTLRAPEKTIVPGALFWDPTYIPHGCWLHLRVFCHEAKNKTLLLLLHFFLSLSVTHQSFANLPRTLIPKDPEVSLEKL